MYIYISIAICYVDENWCEYGEAHDSMNKDGSAYPVVPSDHRGSILIWFSFYYRYINNIVQWLLIMITGYIIA